MSVSRRGFFKFLGKAIAVTAVSVVVDVNALDVVEAVPARAVLPNVRSFLPGIPTGTFGCVAAAMRDAKVCQAWKAGERVGSRVDCKRSVQFGERFCTSHSGSSEDYFREEL